MQSTQQLWDALVKARSTARRLKLIAQLKDCSGIRCRESRGLIRIARVTDSFFVPDQVLQYISVLDKVKVKGKPKRWVIRVPTWIRSKEEGRAWSFKINVVSWKAHTKKET